MLDAKDKLCQVYEDLASAHFASVGNEDQLRYDLRTIKDHFLNLRYISEIPVRSAAVDIGCAYGTTSLYLKHLGWTQILAVDKDFRCVSLQYLVENNITFLIKDLRRDCFSQKFDLAVFTEVLEHLPIDPRIPMRKIFDCLNPSGRLVLSTPDLEQGYPPGKEQKRHYSELPISGGSSGQHNYIYTKAEIEELCADAGFSLEKIKCEGKFIFCVAARE